ncbi:hypothetical protein CRYUN_Cryun22dG0128500 [Craigia yunnanensis]
MGRTMEWAGRDKDMGGIPRKIVFLAVGAFAKAAAALLNTTSVHNADTPIHLVRSRPPDVPLLTISNHMSTLDDPLIWGFKGFPSLDAKLARWVLAAEDICFKNSLLIFLDLSLVKLCVFDRLFVGSDLAQIITSSSPAQKVCKCIPITRGAGIYQEHMNEALQCLNNGAWLQTFPEGKVSQEDAPIKRLKWGTASLIVRAHVTPIVLPMIHCGFEEVMPENYFLERSHPFPLCNKEIKIIIGEPIEFDIPKMRQLAISMHRDLSFSSSGWPFISPYGLDEAAQRCLCSTISEQIQTAMEGLRSFGRSFLK